MPTLFKTEAPAGFRSAYFPSVPGRVAFCLLASITCLVSGSPRFLLPLAALATGYGLLFTPFPRVLWGWLGLAILGGLTWASTTILLAVWPAMGEWAEGYNAAVPVIRMWIVAHAAMTLTAAVNLTELFRAVSALPLPYVLKLPFLLIVRFLPSFVNESRLLAEAARIRFAGRGARGWIIRPIQAWRVLFMPVVVRIIRTGDELAMATELKGVSPRAFPSDGRGLFSGADRFLLGTWLLAAAAAMTFYWMTNAGG